MVTTGCDATETFETHDDPTIRRAVRVGIDEITARTEWVHRDGDVTRDLCLQGNPNSTRHNMLWSHRRQASMPLG